MITQPSIHRVRPAWRWITAVLAPPLLALMTWWALAAIGNYRSGASNATLPVVVFAVLMAGAYALTAVAGVLFAFRGRIVLDGDTMTLTGAFSSRVITADQLEGYRDNGGRLFVFLRQRRAPILVGAVENMPVIWQWVRSHTRNLADAGSPDGR